jgi:hypothetical protein
VNNFWYGIDYNGIAAIRITNNVLSQREPVLAVSCGDVGWLLDKI